MQNQTQAQLTRSGIGLLFLIVIIISIYFTTASSDGRLLLVIAAVIGGYMAMNIGANDVANNVGPAVGSQALTLTGAIIIAIIFEAAGALIAGGDVVSTIKKGIIDPSMIQDTDTFIWLMMSALLSGALWLNLATAMGAPVSTTHSIVGGVLGAGIAAGGIDIANWDKMAEIAASWVISPVMGGLIAAAFLYLIKRKITYRTNKLAAAKIIVPLLLMAMAWSFSTYLLLKGLKHIWKVDFLTAAGISVVIAIAVYIVFKPVIIRSADTLKNNKESISQLFTIPLIFAAAFLSFAHGANDVANAVGPLAAIKEAIGGSGVTSKASIPLWIMMIGAAGIAIGLALYGPKLIKTVGSEITDLDKTRAFCVAMAASITVIIASQLGLPVSSTHIAVGGIFGVGFLREYLKSSYSGMIEEIKHHHEDDDTVAVERFLDEFDEASLERKNVMLKQLKENSARAHLMKKERKKLSKVYRTELVKRSHLKRIVAAWIITVPATGGMAALIYFMIRGMML
ncbi:MAG: putative phosphate permease [bacterium]|nr:MAG: putative phosphate permease [bacterium]